MSTHRAWLNSKKCIYFTEIIQHPSLLVHNEPQENLLIFGIKITVSRGETSTYFIVGHHCQNHHHYTNIFRLLPWLTKNHNSMTSQNHRDERCGDDREQRKNVHKLSKEKQYLICSVCLQPGNLNNVRRHPWTTDGSIGVHKQRRDVHTVTPLRTSPVMAK